MPYHALSCPVPLWRALSREPWPLRGSARPRGERSHGSLSLKIKGSRAAMLPAVTWEGSRFLHSLLQPSVLLRLSVCGVCACAWVCGACAWVCLWCLPVLCWLAVGWYQVQFRHPFRYKHQKELMVAAEGMYTGQFIYCGKRATLTVGNVLPVRVMPEGSIVCNLEQHVGDRGSLARTSGGYAIIVSHNPDNGTTRCVPHGTRTTVTLSSYDPVTLSPCHPATLLRCYPVIRLRAFCMFHFPFDLRGL